MKLTQYVQEETVVDRDDAAPVDVLVRDEMVKAGELGSSLL